MSWLKTIWINCLTDSVGQELGHSLAEWIWLRVSYKAAINVFAGAEVISKLGSKKHPLFLAYLVLGRIQFLTDYWVRPHRLLGETISLSLAADQELLHRAAYKVATGLLCNKLARE